MAILTNHQTNTLGKNDDTDLLTFTSGELDVAGTVDATNFKVNGAQGSDGQVLTSTGSGVAWEDASGGGGGTSIADADGDTKIQVEESSDEDIIRFDAGGNQIMMIRGDNKNVGIGGDPTNQCALLIDGQSATGTTKVKIAGTLSSYAQITAGTVVSSGQSAVEIAAGSSTGSSNFINKNRNNQLVTNALGSDNYHYENSDNFQVAGTAILNGLIGLGGANYGTSGQVLTSNGSSSDPTWQTASGGGAGQGHEGDTRFTANFTLANSDKGKRFITDTKSLTITLPDVSTLDSDWFVEIETEGTYNGMGAGSGTTGKLTLDPQYSSLSQRINGNTTWEMRARQWGRLYYSGTTATGYNFGSSSVSTWGFDHSIDGAKARANATGKGALAFAGQAEATGNGAVALGQMTQATASQAVAIGESAYATGYRSLGFAGSRAASQYGVALQIQSTSSSYGAINDEGIAIGQSAQASGYSVNFAIGQEASSSGHHAHAIGFGSIASGVQSIAVAGRGAEATGNTSNAFGSFAKATGAGALALSTDISGYKTEATGAKSIAIGNRAKSSEDGKMAFTNHAFSANGDAQHGTFVLVADTTDATATILTTTNATAASSNQIKLNSDTVITFHGTLSASQQGAAAHAGYEIKGVIVNDGGTTSLTASSVTTIGQANASSWVVACSADNTNNVLNITVTGEASHNIRWVASIQTSEVTYT